VDFWARQLEEAVRPEEGDDSSTALRTLGRFLDVLAGLLAARAAGSSNSPEGAWLNDSLRLLGSPGVQGWMTPQQVAQKVGLSYENFRKQFAARAGVSPGQFQKRKRVERAQSAIYHGGHTLKQVAEELEFCDVFHFSKAFKQVTGETPSEFRRKVRGG
jgi:AraC-like DNA-binding protein